MQGAKIRPRQVKKAHLEFGHNIEISEDRKKLTSLVDGHVSLVEGKVFVSDVYEVENVRCYPPEILNLKEACRCVAMFLLILRSGPVAM